MMNLARICEVWKLENCFKSAKADDIYEHIHLLKASVNIFIVYYSIIYNFYYQSFKVYISPNINNIMYI